MTSVRHVTVAALAVHVSLGTVSSLLFLAAFGFRIDWLLEPARLVEGGPHAAALFRWAAVADLYSYYLPVGLVAIVLWFVLRHRNEPLATAGLVGALGYVLLGGAGASVLALAGAPLIESFADPAADHATVRTLFATLIDVVFRAVWQFVDLILLATWMTSTALLLRRDRPGLARLSLVLGGLFTVVAALTLLGLGLARDALLGVVFVLWIAWSVWVAVLVWRLEPPFDDLETVRRSSRNDPRTIGPDDRPEPIEGRTR
ncbi:MAG TPA: hypothetical protein VM344_01095 [Vitreimonas sp.]|nr:hypothetical protein [Vitreimonas sp.]